MHFKNIMTVGILAGLMMGCSPEAEQSKVVKVQTVEAVAKPTTKPAPNPVGFNLKPPIATKRSERPEIPLLDAADTEQWETFFSQTIVRNVTRPAIYPIHPPKGAENGKAIIVVPGGGYQLLALSEEGYPVAERLAQAGYTAFVLKYRTFQSPRDGEGFLTATAEAFSNLGKDVLPDHPDAVDDLALAIDYVRAHCADFGCEPDKVGVIGFSAGARTAIRLLENKPQASDLQNVALMYPPSDTPVKGNVRPPLFTAIAVNDPLFRQGRFSLVEQWLSESDNIEFHLYANGDHGFGMRDLPVTATLWIDQYIHWLDLVGTKE